MHPTLSFHGGAGTVTGSRYLVTTAASRMLIDAGLFQGLKKLRLMNWARPSFDPRKVDHLLLTHAHIDHAGYLPRLVREGFSSPVYCTKATRELARLLLMDAAKIQEEDARYANRKGFSKHKPALPLYTSEDADAACDLMEPVEYGEWLELAGGLRARFLNMGHILGSAMIEAHIQTPAGERRIVFSGDVGRFGVPLHSDPDPLPACDALVVESTYGDREHQHSPVEEQLRDALLPTIEAGGTVLIPSFAVGRAQLVTLSLRHLINDGRLPDVPIHIDSPMAVDATRLYSKYLKDLSLDEDLTQDGRSRLFPRNVHFHRSVKESKALNAMPGPRIIISASGMLAGGRVLHHLRRLLPREDALVMLVGYQAAGTRGRAMLEGAERIRIHGSYVPIRAKFIALGGFSAHADRNELLRWIFGGPQSPDTIFVTHGEPDAAQAFAELLRERSAATIHMPGLGDSYPL